MPRLALFDLDNTLLHGDSDYLWGCFLVQQRIVDPAWYEAENRRYYDDYRNGCLDIQAYLAFQLGHLAGIPQATLHTWHQQFMAEMIEPIILPKGVARIQSHQAAGDLVMIITATNRFVTAPIAKRLGVEWLLATELEEKDGLFTGQPKGTPCFQHGKVTLLQEWLASHNANLEGSWFYSDSRNDLPLLELVTNPVAVDPDPVLRQTALQRGWKLLSLREPEPEGAP